MVRKKKEDLVHLDIEALTEEVREKPAAKKTSTAIADLTLGETLRKTRERKRYQLHTISKKLKIKESYLDALEKGHYYVFPGLVYGIGFLRSYADFLGLDLKTVMDRFHAETSNMSKTAPMDMPIPEKRNVLPSGRMIVKVLLLIIIIYLVWYIAVSLMYPVSARHPVMSTPVVSETAVSPNDTAVTTSAIDAPVPVADTLAVAVVAPINDLPPREIAKKTTQKEVVIEKQAPKIYGLAKPAVLYVIATEETWIEISDKKDVILSQVLMPGDSYNAPEDSSGMTLKTGNAGGLDLYVNQGKMNPLGEKGETKTIELSKKAFRKL